MQIFVVEVSFFFFVECIYFMRLHLTPIESHHFSFYWINSNSKWRRGSRDLIQFIIVQLRKLKPRRLWGLAQSSEYIQRSQSYGQRKEDLEGTRWGLGPRFITVTLDSSALQFFSSIKWNYNAYLPRVRWEFNENVKILCNLWSTPQPRGRYYCNVITIRWALSGALYYPSAKPMETPSSCMLSKKQPEKNRPCLSD